MGAATPSIGASPAQVAPGDNLTVSGTGFPPGSPLLAELFSDPVRLGSATADQTGAFRIVVTVPAGIPPGLHTLRVRSLDGPARAETTVRVSVPTVLQAATSFLARTGADVARAAEAAAALVLGGGMLMALAHDDGAAAWLTPRAAVLHRRDDWRSLLRRRRA